MNKTWANMVYQAGSVWSQPQPAYYNQAQQQSAQAYQHALHGVTPGTQVKQLKWMFDGEPLDLTDFVDKVFGDDEHAKTIFLLKHSK